MAAPTPEEIERQRAIKEVRLQARDYIRTAVKHLEEEHYEIRMGGELYFFPINEKSEPHTLSVDDLDQAKSAQGGSPVRFSQLRHSKPVSGSGASPYELASHVSPHENIKRWDPLHIARNLDVIKRNLPDLAKKYGASGVTFEAKPYPDQIDTCGMHLNISLWKDGKNQFALSNPTYVRNSDAPHQHSVLERFIIRSLLEFQHEGMLAFAPQKTSYDRYKNFEGFLNKDIHEQTAVMQAASPNKIAVDNDRQTLVRMKILRNLERSGDPHRPYNAVPVSPSINVHTQSISARQVRTSEKRDADIPSEECRVENRLAGSDADPYVVVAVTMAAIVHGVEEYNKHLKNPKKYPEPKKYRQFDIPQTHEHAKKIFQNSSLIKYWLAPPFMPNFFSEILAAYGSGQPLPPPERAVGRSA
ncbi:MAG: hypothetical protein U1E36_06895 [Rickettsiales bacterium]